MNNFERMKINESQFSADDLRVYLSYDYESGDLTWIKNSTRTDLIGKKAGSLITNKAGNKYLNVKLQQVPLKAHRIIWCMHYGKWPKQQIDHEDGDGLNNRIDNMRDVSHGENKRNQRQNKNSNGFRGCHFDKRRGTWSARIGHDGQQIHLGTFSTPEEALAVRIEAEKKYGYHPTHGRSR